MGIDGSVGSSSNAPWYDQTWFLVVALLIFFPVGLWLVWKHKPWARGLKVGVTAIVAVLFVGAAASASTSTPKPKVAAAIATTTSSSVAVTTSTTEPPATTTASTTTTRAPTTTRATVPPTAPPATTPPTAAPSPPPDCTPGYSPCIPPGPDVDCAGGSGNGPRYVHGPVQVTGPDIYGLDTDHDGIGCE